MSSRWCFVKNKLCLDASSHGEPISDSLVEIIFRKNKSVEHPVGFGRLEVDVKLTLPQYDLCRKNTSLIYMIQTTRNQKYMQLVQYLSRPFIQMHPQHTALFQIHKQISRHSLVHNIGTWTLQRIKHSEHVQLSKTCTNFYDRARLQIHVGLKNGKNKHSK